MLQKNPQERHFKGGKITLPRAVAKRMEHNHKTRDNEIILPQNRTQIDTEY